MPFAPHIDNRNQLLSVRDANGAIRIADPANVPISRADAELERDMLVSRTNGENKTYRLMLADIRAMV